MKRVSRREAQQQRTGIGRVVRILDNDLTMLHDRNDLVAANVPCEHLSHRTTAEIDRVQLIGSEVWQELWAVGQSSPNSLRRRPLVLALGFEEGFELAKRAERGIAFEGGLGKFWLGLVAGWPARAHGVARRVGRCGGPLLARRRTALAGGSTPFMARDAR